MDLNSNLEKGIQYQKEARLDEAAECYRVILKHDPHYADANHLLGLVLHQQGRHDAALVFIDKAITTQPKVAMYHANRGRVLKATGHNSAAISAYSMALRLDPGNGITLSDLAAALVDNGDFKHAELFAHRAVKRAPDLAVAHYNYGLAAKFTNQVGLAYRAFKRSLELEPNFSMALFELGELHQSEDENEFAKEFYLRALAVNPALFEAHVNLGNILRGSFELEEAVGHYRTAIAIQPYEAAVHGNLGVALQELGMAEAALEAYDRSIVLDSHNAEIQRNRAQVLLQMGRYSEGWPAFESRWNTKHFAAIRREWKNPKWDGQEGDELTVLVHAEQGFGDTIQFSRYLPLLAERVGNVFVECPLPLADLMVRCKGVDEVIAAGTPLPKYDFHIPMMSLPGVFKTVLQTIPTNVPYLSIKSRLRQTWVDRIGGDDLLKVGLVWKGSSLHQRNSWRSPGLAQLKPLLDLQGIHWVSLQKDDEGKDLQVDDLAKKIVPLGSDLRDFSDTGAIISHLDLIISPDTAVAHLAGALNCPVWLMLPHVAEWRWLMDCDYCPWYPSMRLFRQLVRQDWSDPIKEMVFELQMLAK